MRNALLEHPGLKPGKLTLHGNRSKDAKFQGVLAKVLWETYGPGRLRWLIDDVDSTFAGAIGAAELLKRKKLRERYRKKSVLSRDIVVDDMLGIIHGYK